MTQLKSQQLAKAVCAWLAYRDLTGDRTILSEALLTLPISEYLASGTGWQLTPEFSYRKLKDASNLPDLWGDFSGSRKYGESIRFILEAKYLRSKAQNRSRQIVADIVRLSLPPAKEITRYFLLAGPGEYFPDPDWNFIFGRALFGLRPPDGGVYIQPSKEVQKPEFLASFPAFGALMAGSAVALVPKKAWVQCRASESFEVGGNRSFRVMVWTVARAKNS